MWGGGMMNGVCVWLYEVTETKKLFSGVFFFKSMYNQKSTICGFFGVFS